jgi:CheY-like chemotaxis protein
MPGLDGFEVATRLRGEVGVLGETVVMLTSDTRAGDVARARQLGLAAYLVKPIKRADLIRTIAALATPPSANSSAAAPTSPAQTEIIAAERPLRVLLVDDSSDNRMLIQAYLKKLPYQIDTAEDGLAGFTKVREHTYDVVLMDMLMPVMDGLEATQAIRAWERAEGRQATPVVALTANAMEDDVRRCLNAGCDAHVAKPVKKAALLESIARYARSA